MKFSYLVTITATLMLSASVNAQDAQDSAEATGSSGVVIVNSNTNSAAATNTTTVQPTTVVEASPVTEAKSEALRKARQSAEVQTEQKIVEKLEESRFRDEQSRAERLFGNKLENNGQIQNNATATVVTAPVVQEVKEDKPATVHIEKIEIVQPKEHKFEEVTPVTPVVPATAVSVAPMEHEHMEEDTTTSQLYVGAGIGSSNYNASNVDSSYSIGLTVGKKMSNRWAIEGLFNYSSHNIDTYWQSMLYREMDQYDFGAGAKYYLMDNMWKPYIGGQVIYSYRKYKDRNLDYCGYLPYCDPTLNEETTHAIDIGPMIGLDVEVSPQFLIGADFKYNYNFVNKRDINYAKYGVPEGTRPLEEISFYTFQITAKMLF